MSPAALLLSPLTLHGDASPALPALHRGIGTLLNFSSAPSRSESRTLGEEQGQERQNRSHWDCVIDVGLNPGRKGLK